MTNEVVVDTCFLEKITSKGMYIGDMKRVMDTLDFKPVVHPYIAKHELSVTIYLKELIDSGYIRVVSWNEFIEDEFDKSSYENYIYDLHEELRQYLLAKNGIKKVQSLDRDNIEKHGSIFMYRCSGTSLGDVHMVLMAVFMELPIILSEDSDIDALRSITERKFESSQYKLKIFNSIDLLKLFADNENSAISRKELIDMVRHIGERKRQVEVTDIWDARNK